MINGTLYGIGVGPGDPELITLKAIKILRQVDVVFAAASTKNSYSLAMEIVAPHLKNGAPVVRLGFPMTRDKNTLNTAWKENAHKVVTLLKEGRDAAMITLGDPMTYSTFGYVMHTIKEGYPDIRIRIVPGITSYHAAAAAAGQVLAEAEESFTVISGALGAQKLKEVIDHTDNVVILKVYKNYKEIIDTLNHLDLAAGSVLISRCGLDGEEVIRDLKEGLDIAPSYLSLLLIRKNGGT
jgi:precorrin-2/cobalt-factor-2 C20-methyltransferase